MRLVDLAGCKVGVLGLGKEGKAAVAALQTLSPKPAITVFNESEVPEDEKTELVIGPFQPERLNAQDVLIRSPGISIYRPELAALNPPVTTGTNLWFAERADTKTVAITGTKGKSTVSALVSHFLAAAGVTHRVAGNFGIPLLATLDDDPVDVEIIEMSSYQAADFDGQADVGVLTNLFPEHLDWHGNLERYYHDKLRLLRQSDRVVVSANCAESNRRVSDANAIWANSNRSWQVSSQMVSYQGQIVSGPLQWQLAGAHNRSNLALALSVVHELGVETEPGLNRLSQFKGLAHRQQLVAESNGMRFVDDSISTTPHATLAAIEALGDPLVVIVGGMDRGINWDEFARALNDKPVRAVVIRGQNASAIEASLQANCPGQRRVHRDSLEDAVIAARQFLPEGGTVVLSPGAPSYGEFANFVERGRAFAEIVSSLTA